MRVSARGRQPSSRRAGGVQVEWSGTPQEVLHRSVYGKTMPIRIRLVAITLTVGIALVAAACLMHDSAKDPDVPSKRMADGHHWTTNNLNINSD